MRLILLAATAVTALSRNHNPAYSCRGLSARAPPDDVRQLKPMDVKVVAAMGDSITAGFALSGKPVESRDESYATGNATDAITLATIHARFRGRDAVNGVNVAVTNDAVKDMPGQAHALVANLTADPRVDITKDWKLVTLFIGANNDCPACQGDPANAPSAYASQLGEALEVLEKGLPRTIVSMVSMMNISSLRLTPGADKYCALQHILTRIECPCVFEGDKAVAAVDATVRADNAVLARVAASYRAKQSKSFAVVLQPALQGITVPDWTYLSRFDCFHPSLEAHQQIAQALWNNLLEPVGKKTTTVKLPVKFRCPTDDDFIYS